MSFNHLLPTVGVLRKQTTYVCSVSATLQIQLPGIHSFVYLSTGNYLNCRHIIRVSGCVYYCVSVQCAFVQAPNSAQREGAVGVISPLQTVSKWLCNHFKDLNISFMQLTQKENGLSRDMECVYHCIAIDNYLLGNILHLVSLHITVMFKSNHKQNICIKFYLNRLYKPCLIFSYVPKL